MPAPGDTTRALSASRLAAFALVGLLSSAAVSAQPAATPQPATTPAPGQTINLEVTASGETATLTYLNRPIVTLRARIIGRSPAERRAGAVRVLDDLVEAGQTGPVESTSEPAGSLVTAGGRLVIGLVEEDLDRAAGETLPEVTAQTVARLRVVLAEAVEVRRPAVWLQGGLLTLAALVVASLLFYGLARTRQRFLAHLSLLAQRAVARAGLGDHYSSRASDLLAGFQRRVVTLLTFLLQLTILYALLTFTLRRFPFTRPWGESLRQSMLGTLSTVGLGMLNSIPAVFTVLVIFLTARGVMLLLDPWFAAIERGAFVVSWLHSETTATTRRLVTIAVWLFAFAMAFPYIPGSDTDAFRGMSVAVGLMVTLGSSGLVNQVMSSFVLTYSRALRLGDFVRIGDVEGTIIEVGMLSTKLRTLRAEEVTIPNAVVVAQTTTDYSRFDGQVLTASSVSVGYAVPWRQVYAMLTLAAERTPGIRAEPKPRVLQPALDEMSVKYTLIFCLEAQEARTRTISALHERIQDLFNEYGVQIMTPSYEADPPEPKVVAKADWYAAPAHREGPPEAGTSR